MLFLICSWRFLISNKLEELAIKLEKKYWDLGLCRKSQKNRQQQQKRKTTKYSTTRPLLFHFLWLFDAQLIFRVRKCALLLFIRFTILGTPNLKSMTYALLMLFDDKTRSMINRSMRLIIVYVHTSLWGQNFYSNFFLRYIDLA